MFVDFRGTKHILAMTALAGLVAAPGMRAAEPHVVSPAELRAEVQSASETRRQNVARLQEFLSSEPARKALETTHTDAAKIRQAVPLLSDAELARLNAQAAKVQSDFAAGELTTTQVTIIIVGAILIAVVIAIAAA